ncbi:MAG: hypothetical protein H0V10_09665 [Geodermatophilaceae bacterium]|nr:hypothetical protein [Geodermatophilaceae bacterium]
MQLVVEELVPIPPAVLCPVQGEVRLLHQVDRDVVGPGRDRDSDAHRLQQRLLIRRGRSADLEGLAQNRHEAFGEFVDVLGAGQALGQYDELVPAVAGDTVGRTARRHEPLGGGDQHLVAHPVTQGVVHRLEPVQVEEQYGDRSGGALEP